MRSGEMSEPTERDRALHAIVVGALLGMFLALVGRRRGS
jgi:uncharacterized protein involved in response to NO